LRHLWWRHLWRLWCLWLLPLLPVVMLPRRLLPPWVLLCLLLAPVVVLCLLRPPLLLPLLSRLLPLLLQCLLLLRPLILLSRLLRGGFCNVQGRCLDALGWRLLCDQLLRLHMLAWQHRPLLHRLLRLLSLLQWLVAWLLLHWQLLLVWFHFLSWLLLLPWQLQQLL
jgi:hypothetical protein